MNKKILVSLCVIAAVAVIAIGGTIAYFRDVETSTGNTFTAGKLDLIVDINGEEENPLVSKFFDLGDMKPGDSGEKTISLKVVDNPACGFVDINITSDADNSCNEPEKADEPGCLDNDIGELNDNVNWAIWSDMGSVINPACEELKVYPGDNKYNPECDDKLLTGGTLTGNESWSIGGLDKTTQYYGIAYCFGTLGANMTCDGSSVNNASQSDSFTGDIIFTAKQYRNQFGAEGTWPAGCPAVGELPH